MSKITQVRTPPEWLKPEKRSKIVYDNIFFRLFNKVSSLYLQAVKIYRLDDFTKDPFCFSTNKQGACFMKQYFISVKHKR